MQRTVSLKAKAPVSLVSVLLDLHHRADWRSSFLLIRHIKKDQPQLVSMEAEFVAECTYRATWMDPVSRSSLDSSEATFEPASSLTSSSELSSSPVEGLLHRLSSSSWRETLQVLHSFNENPQLALLYKLHNRPRVKKGSVDAPPLTGSTLLQSLYRQLEPQQNPADEGTATRLSTVAKFALATKASEFIDSEGFYRFLELSQRITSREERMSLLRSVAQYLGSVSPASASSSLARNDAAARSLLKALVRDASSWVDAIATCEQIDLAYASGRKDGVKRSSQVDSIVHGLGSFFDRSIVVSLLKRCEMGDSLSPRDPERAASWCGALHVYHRLAPGVPRDTPVSFALMAALRKSGRWAECATLLGSWLKRKHHRSEAALSTQEDTADTPLRQSAGSPPVASTAGALESGIMLECFQTLGKAAHRTGGAAWKLALQLLEAVHEASFDPPRTVYEAVLGGIPSDDGILGTVALKLAVSALPRRQRSLWKALEYTFERQNSAEGSLCLLVCSQYFSSEIARIKGSDSMQRAVATAGPALGLVALQRLDLPLLRQSPELLAVFWPQYVKEAGEMKHSNTGSRGSPASPFVSEMHRLLADPTFPPGAEVQLLNRSVADPSTWVAALNIFLARLKRLELSSVAATANILHPYAHRLIANIHRQAGVSQTLQVVGALASSHSDALPVSVLNRTAELAVKKFGLGFESDSMDSSSTHSDQEMERSPMETRRLCELLLRSGGANSTLLSAVTDQLMTVPVEESRKWIQPILKGALQKNVQIAAALAATLILALPSDNSPLGNGDSNPDPRDVALALNLKADLIDHPLSRGLFTTTKDAAGSAGMEAQVLHWSNGVAKLLRLIHSMPHSVTANLWEVGLSIIPLQMQHLTVPHDETLEALIPVLRSQLNPSRRIELSTQLLNMYRNAAVIQSPLVVEGLEELQREAAFAEQKEFFSGGGSTVSSVESSKNPNSGHGTSRTIPDFQP
jgi:hypothetical protein